MESIYVTQVGHRISLCGKTDSRQYPRLPSPKFLKQLTQITINYTIVQFPLPTSTLHQQYVNLTRVIVSVSVYHPTSC